MSVKRLAVVACAFGAMISTGAFAQAIVNAPARPLAVAPERAAGVELRRVTTQKTAALVYEYQTPAGAARVSVDPTSLVNDIERSRKRAPKKAAVKSVAPAIAEASVQEEAPRPEIVQANVETIEAAPVQREARKVRVIPLYNTPSQD